MSSQSVNKKHHIITYYDTPKEESINFSNIIIPFSNFGKSKNPSCIYDGNEKIPFRERHSIYQAILKHEFVDD